MSEPVSGGGKPRIVEIFESLETVLRAHIARLEAHASEMVASQQTVADCIPAIEQLRQQSIDLATAMQSVAMQKPKTEK